MVPIARLSCPLLTCGAHRKLPIVHKQQEQAAWPGLGQNWIWSSTSTFWREAAVLWWEINVFTLRWESWDTFVLPPLGQFPISCDTDQCHQKLNPIHCPMFQLWLTERMRAGCVCVGCLLRCIASMPPTLISHRSQCSVSWHLVSWSICHLVSVAEMPVFQSDASVAIHQCGSGASLTSWATSAPAPPSTAGLADNTLALLHSLSVLCFFSTEGFWIFAF